MVDVGGFLCQSIDLDSGSVPPCKPGIHFVRNRKDANMSITNKEHSVILFHIFIKANLGWFRVELIMLGVASRLFIGVWVCWLSKSMVCV